MIILPVLFQLAWSHDSEGFIIIGKGPDSALVMYSLTTPTNKRETPTTTTDELGGVPSASLQLCWQVKASDTLIEDDKNTAAFVMGEVTPSGHVFTVQERAEHPTVMQLWRSVDGALLQTAAVPPCVKSGGSVGVGTTFMSVHSNGCYAMGVQGGRVLIVKDDLTITATITVVSARVCVMCEGV